MILGAVGRAVFPMPGFPRWPAVRPRCRTPKAEIDDISTESSWFIARISSESPLVLAGFIEIQTDVSCVHWIWSLGHMFYQ